MPPHPSEPATDDVRELEGRISYPLPRFNMEELYNPVMITIKIPLADGTEDKKNFKMPREMICRHSGYFRGLFEGGFRESRARVNTLRDVAADVFATFFDFCHLNEITQAGDQNDCTNWPWQFLFECYVFGDKYSAQGYRARVFEAIQTKMLMRTPHAWLFPESEEIKYLYDHTGPSNLLRKFLVDAYINEVEINVTDDTEEAEDVATYPAEFIKQAMIFARRQNSLLNCKKCQPQGTREACDNKAHNEVTTGGIHSARWCQYHEHGDDDEDETKVACLWRRHAIAWKFMEPDSSSASGSEDGENGE